MLIKYWAFILKLFFGFLLTFAIISEIKAQANVNNVDQVWKTDKTNRSVDLDEFQTLLVRDGIPPIYEPTFWTKETGEQLYFKHEPVIAIEIEGKARAYPLSVLMFHEIVNDEINGTPLIATFCPLCNTSVVFDRRLQFKGKNYTLDFGVSGMLRNSDMVMWDHQTETWWQQFTGTGLVGDLNTAQLTIIPSVVISLEEFFENYPQGEILSTNTGMNGRYGQNPYVNYDDLDNKQPRLFSGKVDDRLPAMERVISVQTTEKYIVYPYTEIIKEGVINDAPDGMPVVLFHQAGQVSVLDKRDIKSSKNIGSITVFNPVINGKLLKFIKTEKGFEDDHTGSLWTITGKAIDGTYKGQQLELINHGNHFAFAWFAFMPESEVYKQ